MRRHVHRAPLKLRPGHRRWLYVCSALLLVSGIVALSFNHGTFLGQIPLWLTGTIIGRDLLKEA